jgi:phage head maturation protease
MSHVVETPSEQYPKKGLFVLAEIFDDIVEALKFKSAMLKDHMLAFSIGGEALRKRTVCDTDTHCINQITFMDLFEVSACERGMNPQALSRVMKSTITNPLLEQCNTGEELLKKLRQ